MTSRICQSGQYLILGLLALIIFSLLLAYGISTFIKGRDSAQTSMQASNLIQMLARTRELFRGSADGFVGAGPITLVNNNVVPASMVKGNKIVSPFGIVTVSPGPLTVGNPGVFFTYPAVPKGQCSQFVMQIASSFAVLVVGNTVVKNEPMKMKLSRALLGKECAAKPYTLVNVGAPK